MQLFVRCGGAAGTIAVETGPHESFQDLSSRLGAAPAARAFGHMVSFLCTYSEVSLLPAGNVVTPTVHTYLCLLRLQCFEFRGHTWPQHTQLAAAGVRAGDFIALHQRLRGGGGDGGSTGAESRSSFLEMYATKKAAKVLVHLHQSLHRLSMINHQHVTHVCCATLQQHVSLYMHPGGCGGRAHSSASSGHSSAQGLCGAADKSCGG